MKNLLIVGARSSIASSFIKNYQGQYKLIIADYKDNYDIRLDLTKEYFTFPKDLHIHKAIIFSSLTNIEKIESNKELAKQINFYGTIALVSALNRIGCKCLFLSSNTVFANNAIGTSEADVTFPNTYYGELKLKTEQVILKSNLNTVLRMTKVFNNNSILKSWLDRLSNNLTVNAYSNLRVAPLPYLFVLNWISVWLDSDSSGIYHLSPDTDICYEDLCKYLCACSGYDINLIETTCAPALINFNPLKAYLECTRKQSQAHDLSKCLKQIIFELFNPE